MIRRLISPFYTSGQKFGFLSHRYMPENHAFLGLWDEKSGAGGKKSGAGRKNDFSSRRDENAVFRPADFHAILHENIQNNQTIPINQQNSSNLKFTSNEISIKLSRSQLKNMEESVHSTISLDCRSNKDYQMSN